MIKGDSNSDYISSNNLINHFGIISKITKNTVTVYLDTITSCHTCNAKSACGISDSNTKEIEINNNYPSMQINERVNVLMRKELGLKAVFFAYVFPFILMFITLILASFFFKEWLAGLLSIFILIPYYIVLYLLKDSFENYFNTSIVKNN